MIRVTEDFSSNTTKAGKRRVEQHVLSCKVKYKQKQQKTIYPEFYM